MKLTIGFDTSAINKLQDGSESELLMIALECSFHVRLPGMSAEEVLSNRDPARREQLLARCQQLLTSGECLWPPHEILRLLISAHFRNPSEFVCGRVNVRARIYEQSIIARDFSDELCARQRKEQFRVESNFEKMWKGLRPKLDEVLASEPPKRPATYSDAVSIATARGGVLWGFGAELYRGITQATLSEPEIETFMGLCPPFRGACYGLVMAWFNGALRLRQANDPDPPGRNDLLMATYLPYCKRFVTGDGPQEKGLREVATWAAITCDVQSFRDFSDSFVPPRIAARDGEYRQTLLSGKLLQLEHKRCRFSVMHAFWRENDLKRK